MAEPTVLREGPLTVTDYRCSAGPLTEPFKEWHRGHSISYVRRGSFSYHYRGATHELVAGGLLLGRPGEEYVCTHEHHGCGDECLTFHLRPEVLDSLDVSEPGLRNGIWQTGSAPPLPELVVLGELTQSCANGGRDIALAEVSLHVVARSLEFRDDRPR